MLIIPGRHGFSTFLRTARSFYESLWYLLTYLFTYLRTLGKQKSAENTQLFDEKILTACFGLVLQPDPLVPDNLAGHAFTYRQ